MTGLTDVAALASDENNIYVADTKEVLACPRATGQCGSALTVIASTGSPAMLATEPDAQYIYFGDAAGIHRSPLHAGAPTRARCRSGSAAGESKEWLRTRASSIGPTARAERS